MTQAAKQGPLAADSVPLPKRTPAWNSTLCSCASTTTRSTSAATTATKVSGGRSRPAASGCVVECTLRSALRSAPSSPLRRGRSRTGGAPPGGKAGAKGKGQQQEHPRKEQRARRPASAVLLRGAGRADAEDAFRQELEDREVQNTKEWMKREATLQRSLTERACADGTLVELLQGSMRRRRSSSGRPGSAPAGLGGSRAAQRPSTPSGGGAVSSAPGRAGQKSAGLPKTATEEVKKLCRVLDGEILHHCGRLELKEEAAKWCLPGSAAMLTEDRGKGFHAILKDGLAGRLSPGNLRKAAWDLADDGSDAGAEPPPTIGGGAGPGPGVPAHGRAASKSSNRSITKG